MNMHNEPAHRCRTDPHSVLRCVPAGAARDPRTGRHGAHGGEEHQVGVAEHSRWLLADFCLWSTGHWALTRR